MRCMKASRIADLSRIDAYLYENLIPRIESAYRTFITRVEKFRARHFGVSVITILSLAACQPALWGSPPPPPTLIPPSPTASLAPLPALPVAFTPLPPTSAPTPVVLTAAQVWASPAVPAYLRSKLNDWGFQVLASDPGSARLMMDVAPVGSSDRHLSSWVYALAAPFPTILDDVSSSEIRSAWAGSNSRPFPGSPILMSESTLATFIKLWGQPAAGAVKVVPENDLLQTAWDTSPSWAIIPFERIEPKWKVLMVDGQSPIQKSFDEETYPLTVHYSLSCSEPCQVPDIPTFSFKNRDPQKLTTVILTGVTALVRATAKTMDTKGILYPGEEIRDMLREADVLHINNEVPFYGGCPPPDPNQPKQIFCSAPRYMELLMDVGMDVVELSGDHFADYKEIAMYQTLDIYNQHGIPYYGGGLNTEDGRKPLLMEVNGNKLMFIGCNYKTIYASARENRPGAVKCDFNYMTEQIAYYRAQGYLPISTFQYHEFETAEARPQQMIDFRRMADAGAVIVSGSQAHVPQVMEFYQDSFIHYGLGNLFFDQIAKNGSKIKQHEFIDRHIFYDGKYLGVELITTFLIDYSKPRYMTPQEREKFLTDYFLQSGWVVNYDK